jgi:hypothetical protein
VNRKAIWWGMFIGSTVGGCVPGLWHAGLFSMWSIVLSTIGGLAGIYVAYRMGR